MQDTKHKKSDKRESKRKETPEMSFTMLEGMRYCCSKGGHHSPAAMSSQRQNSEGKLGHQQGQGTRNH
jgi:hypothetical protein